MRLARERILLFGFAAVLFFSAVMAVRQVIENQSRHAERREAFIFLHSKGYNTEAEQMYVQLKFDMPDEPTRHLIDDLQRTSAITPTNQSPITNVLVRYHQMVKHEVEKRLQQRYLKGQAGAEANP